MEKNNFAVELEVLGASDRDANPDLEVVNGIGSVEFELPEKLCREIQEALESNDIGKVLLALEQSGHTYSVLRQGEATRIFIQDKDLEQVRALSFNEAFDEVERSEEIVPELSAEERQELADRVGQRKAVSRDGTVGNASEAHEEDRNIEEDIDRDRLDYRDEVRMNQMLFEAQDIYAVNDVLVNYGLEPVAGDRPYIIEHKDGYETGMKIVFGQESRIINEIANDEARQAILACRTMEEVDKAIKHSGISREDRRNQERIDDEDYRRNVEGPEFSATGRNNRSYEYDNDR